MAQLDLRQSERGVITALSLNARAPLSEIAREVCLSRQAVSYTLEKLTERKVLEGLYAILDIAKMGYVYYRIYFRFQNFTPSREKRWPQDAPPRSGGASREQVGVCVPSPPSARIALGPFARPTRNGAFGASTGCFPTGATRSSCWRPASGWPHGVRRFVW